MGGKLADALGVIIAIKTLSAVDYGVIGTAMGLMAMVGFVSLAPEDILWRDQPRLRDQLSKHLSAYVWFWLVKLGVVAGIAAVFCGIYGVAHQAWGVAGALFVIVCFLQVLTAAPLVEVPLFAGLQQQRGAMFVLVMRVLWPALLVVNFRLHSLAYYVVALAIYAGATATVSALLLRRHFGVTYRFAGAWQKVREAALDLTLWLHLTGRARVFLLRGDLAILGGLGVGLAAVGQYAVAINLVGFGLIVPGVLENVAAVSFANHPDQRSRNLRRYYRIAAALAAAQLAGGLVLGRLALRLLHVADVEATYRIFITVLAGASGMIVASPAVSYAMCFRRMRSVFSRVFLPAAVGFALLVWLAAIKWGVAGAALAHAAVSLVAGAAMVGVVWLGRDEPNALESSTAEAESVFQE